MLWRCLFCFNRLNESVTGYECCKAIAQIFKGGQVKILADCGCSVGQKKDTKIPDKGISGTCFTTEIGHHASDDQVCDIEVS